ncbi:MAG: hypothetical protein WCV62_06745 [Candidatus Peribacteraceae bacterium]|jgi:hypothetical protein
MVDFTREQRVISSRSGEKASDKDEAGRHRQTDRKTERRGDRKSDSTTEDHQNDRDGIHLLHVC